MTNKPVKPEILTGEVVMDNLPEPPPLPDMRTFKVTLFAKDSKGEDITEYVSCHSVEISQTGAAMFFEYNYVVTPTGWAPESRMRRVYAPGRWADAKEEMLMPSAGVIVH